jgi:hypothetical protein
MDERPAPARSVADEGRHPETALEEWTFCFWTDDGSAGGLVFLRQVRAARRTWYWSALVRAGEPLLHVSDWEAPLPATGIGTRSNALWADNTCEAPFEQWTVANEAYAVALDDPADALDRAFGTSTPVAFDLEWYASAPAVDLVDANSQPSSGGLIDGYRQEGRVHGVVELAGGRLVVDDVPAHRTHRWGTVLAAPTVAPAVAHLGLRAPVRLPDGTQLDLVLTSAGWRQRHPAGR